MAILVSHDAQKVDRFELRVLDYFSNREGEENDSILVRGEITSIIAPVWSVECVWLHSYFDRLLDSIDGLEAHQPATLSATEEGFIVQIVPHPELPSERVHVSCTLARSFGSGPLLWFVATMEQLRLFTQELREEIRNAQSEERESMYKPPQREKLALEQEGERSMQLFRMQPLVGQANRMKDFREDCFVCLYAPGIGDLERHAAPVWRQRLAESGMFTAYELDMRIKELQLFVDVMQDGDYVLVADGEYVHVGDLGDYYYVDSADRAEDGSCHRRGVTWLRTLPIGMMVQSLQEFIAAGPSMGRLEMTVTELQLEQWLSGRPGAEGDTANPLDEATIAEAIAILKQAMQGPDAERRERAAIALLQYASGLGAGTNPSVLK